MVNAWGIRPHKQLELLQLRWKDIYLYKQQRNVENFLSHTHTHLLKRSEQSWDNKFAYTSPGALGN
jgi:hypothetical protein